MASSDMATSSISTMAYLNLGMDISLFKFNHIIVLILRCPCHYTHEGAYSKRGRMVRCSRCHGCDACNRK